MARILLLENTHESLGVLKKSLDAHHELIIVGDVSAAFKELRTSPVDLIVSKVHLDEENAFDFLRQTKLDPAQSQIPFVCFCGKLTDVAKVLDPVLEKTANALGAEKYISLDDYYTHNSFDYEKLRSDIEDCLRSNAT